MKAILSGLIIMIIGISASAVFNKGQEHMSISRIELGRKLFFEKILSADSSVSCASCHKPEFAFSDTAAFSKGIHGSYTRRNTPSVLNMKNRPYYFWDGRAASLEEQSLMPIQNPDEMGLPIDSAVARLNRSAVYRILFRQVFRELPTATNLAKALAAFENTLETVNSKFDDWSNNTGKLSASEERGRQLFISERARCFECHFMEDFTNDDFRNIGLFNGKDLNDSGRYLITRNLDDLGKFKTPGLRNIALTAPYMHNGMFRTLEEVVDYYDNPRKWVSTAQNTDSLLLQPIGFTDREKKDLLAFLRTLTDRKYMRLASNKN